MRGFSHLESACCGDGCGVEAEQLSRTGISATSALSAGCGERSTSGSQRRAVTVGPRHKPSDERLEALITWSRRNSLQVDKSTLNQRFLSTTWPKEPFKTRRRAVAIATALAVEGLALLRAGTRSGREVEEAAGYGDGWIGRGGRRAVTICVGRRRGVSSGWNQKRVDTAPVGRAGISIAQSNDNAREHAVAW